MLAQFRRYPKPYVGKFKVDLSQYVCRPSVGKNGADWAGKTGTGNFSGPCCTRKSDDTSSLTDAHSAPRSHDGVPLKHDDAAPSELRTYLLLDSRNVQDSGGAKLVLGPVRKRPGGQPVLTEQKKWEMRYLLRTISIATY